MTFWRWPAASTSRCCRWSRSSMPTATSPGGRAVGQTGPVQCGEGRIGWGAGWVARGRGWVLQEVLKRAWPLAAPTHAQSTACRRYSRNWLKVRALGLTQYHSVLLLDADMAVGGPLEPLFALPVEFAAAPDQSRWLSRCGRCSAAGTCSLSGAGCGACGGLCSPCVPQAPYDHAL